MQHKTPCLKIPTNNKRKATQQTERPSGRVLEEKASFDKK